MRTFTVVRLDGTCEVVARDPSHLARLLGLFTTLALAEVASIAAKVWRGYVVVDRDQETAVLPGSWRQD